MSRRAIEIATAHSKATASLFSPSASPAGRDGKPAGIILYMDAFGLRAAMDEMAARMSALGYHVLVPDLFYRKAPYGPFDARTAFSNEATAAELRGIMAATTQGMTARDTGAFIETLTQAGATGPIGAVGYCFGGGRAITAAATYPDRVAGAMSFHGGNLASAAPDSPHLKASAIKGRVYVGSAGVDGSFPPEQSARFENAMREAEIDFTMENYVGMRHGWCVPDHGVFDPAGAERHWSRLATFFRETLG